MKECKLTIIPYKDCVIPLDQRMIYGIDGPLGPPRPQQFEQVTWPYWGHVLAHNHLISVWNDDPLAWETSYDIHIDQELSFLHTKKRKVWRHPNERPYKILRNRSYDRSKDL